MLNPPSPTPRSTELDASEPTSPPPAQAALAALPPGQQRLVAALVFDGGRCAELARASGVAVSEVREQAGAALVALAAQLVPCEDAPRGAIAAMLALRAFDALDPDEAELVDLMLRHQPTLQRAHARYAELVGELCALVAPRAPSAGVLARLLAAADDEIAN